MAQQISPELLALLRGQIGPDQNLRSGGTLDFLSNGLYYRPDIITQQSSVSSGVGDGSSDTPTAPTYSLQGWTAQAPGADMGDVYDAQGNWTGQRKLGTGTSWLQDLGTFAALAGGAYGLGNALMAGSTAAGGGAAGAAAGSTGGGAAAAAADPFASLGAELATPVSMPASIAPSALPGVGGADGLFAGLGAELAAPVAMPAHMADISIPGLGLNGGGAGGTFASLGAELARPVPMGTASVAPAVAPTVSAGGVGGAASLAGKLKGLVNGDASLGDWASLGLGVAGALDSRDKTQTQQRAPWEPAQPFLRQQINQGQDLSARYQAQPFSPAQQAAYANVGGLLDRINAQSGGLLSDIGAYGSAAYKRGQPQPARQAYRPLDLTGFNGLLGGFGTGGR